MIAGITHIKGQYYFIFYIVNILLEVFLSHETLEGL
jgi:hypothetical protein